MRAEGARRHRATRRVGLLAVALALAVAAAACGTAAPVDEQSAAPKVVKIAVQEPRTGELVGLRTALGNGAELAVQQLSGPLEAKGFTVEVVLFDTGGEPAAGASNAARIVADPQVLGVVGHASSGVNVVGGGRLSRSGTRVCVAVRHEPRGDGPRLPGDQPRHRTRRPAGRRGGGVRRGGGRPDRVHRVRGRRVRARARGRVPQRRRRRRRASAGRRRGDGDGLARVSCPSGGGRRGRRALLRRAVRPGRAPVQGGATGRVRRRVPQRRRVRLGGGGRHRRAGAARRRRDVLHHPRRAGRRVSGGRGVRGRLHE